MPELLGEFSSLLVRQVQAMRQALGDGIQPESEKRSGRFDAEAASAAAGRLRALLEASDADAEEAFSRMQAAAGARIEKTQLDALRSAISEFNFEQALTKLDEITKEYNLTGGAAAS